MTALLILLGSSLALLVYFVLTSKRGWQDEHGFHYGAPEGENQGRDEPEA